LFISQMLIHGGNGTWWHSALKATSKDWNRTKHSRGI
jgi:hypothetical protein